MSYDFELYTLRTLTLESPAPGAMGHLRVDGPDRVEDEDVPPHVLPILGKRRVLFRLHIEGELSPAEQAEVETWLDEAVALSKGVLIDLQTGQYETPTRAGQLIATDEPSAKSGAMVFYFADGEGFYQSGFEQMLVTLARLMPEALPVRYGYYEPLQGRVENGDLSGLIATFKEDSQLLFQKARTPFGHISMAIPCKKTFEGLHPTHFIRRKFLLARVSFELRGKIFAQPALLRRLMALFEVLCVDLDVVYAEIRDGTPDYGGYWFWSGLPDNQVHTLCLGPAYQGVWPEAAQAGRPIGAHHVLLGTDRFGQRPPRPPQELIAPDQTNVAPTGKPKLAPVFPFDYKFDFDTYIW